ncbi:MAG TPA: hypothetical protein VGE45_16110 [Chloroflexia bacterium]|jgi:hypothetical protein
MLVTIPVGEDGVLHEGGVYDEEIGAEMRLWGPQALTVALANGYSEKGELLVKQLSPRTQPQQRSRHVGDG